MKELTKQLFYSILIFAVGNTVLHEIGHYIAALSVGLNPTFGFRVLGWLGPSFIVDMGIDQRLLPLWQSALIGAGSFLGLIVVMSFKRFLLQGVFPYILVTTVSYDLSETTKFFPVYANIIVVFVYLCSMILVFQWQKKRGKK